MMRCLFWASACWFFTAAISLGKLSVAKIFSDHGVLQRGQEIPVWGRAESGSQVIVQFSGSKKRATANREGRWQVVFSALEANADGQSLIVESEGQKIEVQDLVVGEVWYASGQSNMEMTLGSCTEKNEQISERASEPANRFIRMVKLRNPDAPDVLEDLPREVSWRRDSPKNRQSFSALSYFFAKKLSETLHVPVGVIEGSWGGKPIEGFIAREEFDTPQLKSILELADQNQLEALKELEGGVIVRNSAGLPGRIYHSRVAPIAPYALKGFLWYQGESNAGAGEDPRNYRFKTAALVRGWRRLWANQELPFYYVQLPSYHDRVTGWIRLREEQRLALSIPQTGMAVSIDLLDQDIHPSNKFDVADRLARWALAKNYGVEVSVSGPLFESVQREGTKMRVKFRHTGKGLIQAQKKGISPPVEIQSVDLEGFKVADQKGNWHEAQAQISGHEVLVSSRLVQVPVAVKYGCEGEAQNARLYNRSGLPASPFCSELSLLPWERQE